MPYGQPIRQWLDALVQDVYYGIRTLRRTPLATGVMVGSIGLGIGVATAVFTLADVMLLRPLPYPMAARLVVPYQTLSVRSRARQDTVPWSFARYEALRRAAPDLEDAGFATWVDGFVRVADVDTPVRIEAVTRTLLTTFSIQPQSGRVFGNDEDAADVPTTVGMISDHLWRTAYGRNTSVVGSTILVNGTPVVVAGIMPKGFTGFGIGADVWLPVRMMARIDPSARWTERLGAQTGTVIARMTPRMTTAVLRRDLDAALPIIDQIAAESFAAGAVRGIGVTTLQDARRHPLVEPILRLMGVAVASLLLIVCANVASILLARGHVRRGEMGMRIAIGASERRIGRQVLTESMVLGAISLPLGVFVGYFCASTIAELRPALPQNWVLLRGTDLLAGASFAPNMRVLAFASFVTGLATLLFGIGPAVAASRVDAAKLITSGGDSHATAPVRGRQFLVVSQVALATILLVIAGLMTRSLGALLHADLGFDATGVAVLRIASMDTSASARIRRQALIARIDGIPGVTGVATSGCAPFDLACFFTTGVRAVGGTDATAHALDVEMHSVSADYFRVMRIPMVVGRGFLPEDTTVGRTRVILSESAARRLFGTTLALGKQIVFDTPGAPPMDVIGLARDVRFKSVEASASPAVYLLAGEEASAPRLSMMLFVRAATPPDVTISMIRREILTAEAPVSVADARALSDVVRAETSSTRFVATLLLGFAASAVLLAGLGVYGIISYIVAQRSREFGVRLVLGADGQDLLRGMVRRGASLVCGGVAIGVVTAGLGARLLGSFLYGIGSLDVVTYSGVVALVTSLGLLATFIPARRVTRIDPVEALRA